MSARVYDLADRREAAPQPPAGLFSDRYQRLADETSQALAAVRAGRNSRVLRERLSDLANAVRAVAGLERLIAAVWDEAYEQAVIDCRSAQRPGGAR